MKVLVPGNTDGDGTQMLRFVERRDAAGKLLPEGERKEGVQSQEVLRALIDRTLLLSSEQAWHENIEILTHLRAALRGYEARAAHNAIEKLVMPERIEPCGECGHLLCFCNRLPLRHPRAVDLNADIPF